MSDKDSKINFKKERKMNDIGSLKHYRDTTIGLWCTDKPEIIPEDKKHLFFQLKEEEINTKLRPCPWCGSQEDVEDIGNYVLCHNCSCRGPYRPRGGSVDYWNSHTGPSSVPSFSTMVSDMKSIFKMIEPPESQVITGRVKEFVVSFFRTWIKPIEKFSKEY